MLTLRHFEEEDWECTKRVRWVALSTGLTLRGIGQENLEVKALKIRIKNRTCLHILVNIVRTLCARSFIV